MCRIVRSVEPDAFYTVDHAGSVSKIYRPFMPTADRVEGDLQKEMKPFVPS